MQAWKGPGPGIELCSVVRSILHLYLTEPAVTDTDTVAGGNAWHMQPAVLLQTYLVWMVAASAAALIQPGRDCSSCKSSVIVMSKGEKWSIEIVSSTYRTKHLL